MCGISGGGLPGERGLGLIRRIWFVAIIYCNYIKEPPKNNIGNH